MGQTELTFEDGRFRLNTDAGARAFTSRLWLQSNQDLKAAVQFRRYANSVAEKVFKRTLNETYTTPSVPRLSFLDPHQIGGVKHLLSRKRSYLAHAPGAGKTATTIVGFLLSGCERALIIVPPGLTVQWQKEVEKFYKYVSFLKPRVYIIHPENTPSIKRAIRADIIIVPDSIIDREKVQELLLHPQVSPKFVADDESSRFKEITSTRSIAFYGGTARRTGNEFRGLYKGARHVVFLDGSPMPNGRPMELWAPLYTLDPEAIDCMDRHEFGLYFCNGHQDRFGRWKYNGSARPTEFKERLRKRFMHVVNEDELKHPERKRSIIFMDKDVRSAQQKKWERSNLKGLDIAELSENASQGDFARFRRELGVKKIKWVSEYVARRAEDKNEKILVFCWHREVAEGLRAALTKKLGAGSVGMVIGGMTRKNRQKILSAFSKGKLKALVGNIQAIGRGTDGLQNGDRAVFGEYSWSDELNKQCEKRLSRTGSKKKRIPCDYIAVPNSFDEKILSSNFNKERTTKAVMQ